MLKRYRSSLLGFGLAGAILPAIGFAASNAELESQIANQQQSIDALVSTVEALGNSRSDTTLGGYGELHYNNTKSKKEIDFHRFVLFLGHNFSDKIKLFSELEVEHSIAGEGKAGEVELEQAYIDFSIAENTNVKGGMFLMPIGIMNETHEPPTFYGVERNPVEKNIVPSTWWEGGIGLSGALSDQLSYDLALTSGLNVPVSSVKVRSGRQKTSKANAKNLAYTARLKWLPAAGVELGATVFMQDDMSQDSHDDVEGGMLTELHAVVEQGPVSMRALYAQWDIEGDDAKDAGKDEQFGWYVEPAYKINEQFGVFVRYAAWDNSAGSSDDTELEQTNVGINYWPHSQVVVKLDLQDQTDEDNDGFNLGIGYQF
jgi:hypothetical protein